MRPRVFPAEDIDPRVAVRPSLVASMRPRVFPAEDIVRTDDRAADDGLQ